MHAAARHRHIHMVWIARIDDHRMHFRPVGRAVLLRAHPDAILRIVIHAGQRFPALAAVLGTEKPLRRGPGIPDIGFVSVRGREPEGLAYTTAFLAVLRLGESGRLFHLFPLLAEIGRAEHRRAEMAGRRGREKRLAVARVEHDVMDDVAEEMRPVRNPFPARAVAAKKPCAFARRDKCDHALASGLAGGGFLGALWFCSGLIGLRRGFLRCGQDGLPK